MPNIVAFLHSCPTGHDGAHMEFPFMTSPHTLFASGTTHTRLRAVTPVDAWSMHSARESGHVPFAPSEVPLSAPQERSGDAGGAVGSEAAGGTLAGGGAAAGGGVVACTEHAIFGQLTPPLAGFPKNQRNVLTIKKAPSVMTMPMIVLVSTVFPLPTRSAEPPETIIRNAPHKIRMGATNNTATVIPK